MCPLEERSEYGATQQYTNPEQGTAEHTPRYTNRSTGGCCRAGSYRTALS